MNGKHFQLLVISLLTWTTADAQKETFEYFNFKTPVGFTRKQEPAYLDFVKYNERRTAYAEYTLYTSRNANEDVTAAFTNEWNDLVKKGTSVAAPAPTKGEEENGWKSVYGAAQIPLTTGAYTQVLVTLTGHGKVTSISIRFNNDEFATVTEEFLSGVSMLIPPETAGVPQPAAIPAQPTVVTADTGTGKYKGENVVGVWRGIGTSPTMFGVSNAAGTGYSTIYYGSATQVKQIVFMEDGSFCFVYPSEGLLSYATDRTKNPNYWGTYQIIDSQNGKVKAGTLEMPFLLKDGSLLFDGFEFKKQLRKDHQKLEGTFTAESDAGRWQGQTNQEPTVTFRNDGTFSDLGAFYYIRHVRGYTDDKQDNNYGSGHYDIVNYTIVFTYTDGRRIEMAFLDFGVNQIGLNKSLLSRK